MENMQIVQADLALVDQLSEDRILTGWAAGQDPAGRATGRVVGGDFGEHIFGHPTMHVGRRRQDAQADFRVSVRFKLGDGDAQPVLQL